MNRDSAQAGKTAYRKTGYLIQQLFINDLHKGCSRFLMIFAQCRIMTSGPLTLGSTLSDQCFLHSLKLSGRLLKHMIFFLTSLFPFVYNYIHLEYHSGKRGYAGIMKNLKKHPVGNSHEMGVG